MSTVSVVGIAVDALLTDSSVPVPLLPGRGSDYTVVCGEKEFPVHRMILEARSPFFRGMLESNMAEANEGKYVIKDMLEPVARAVLHFIYAGEWGTCSINGYEGTCSKINLERVEAGLNRDRAASGTCHCLNSIEIQVVAMCRWQVCCHCRAGRGGQDDM